jgi:hypothetical protein
VSILVHHVSLWRLIGVEWLSRVVSATAEDATRRAAIARHTKTEGRFDLEPIIDKMGENARPSAPLDNCSSGDGGITARGLDRLVRSNPSRSQWMVRFREGLVGCGLRDGAPRRVGSGVLALARTVVFAAVPALAIPLAFDTVHAGHVTLHDVVDALDVRV